MTRFPALRFAFLMALPALSVGYGALESLLWPDRLWGAHFYAFYPPIVLIVAAGTALAAIGFAWASPGLATGSGDLPEGNAAAAEAGALRPRRRRLALAALGALASGVLFWVLRERHLFWGDALPLSIDIPKGLSFHPDEPLAVFVHQLLFRLGAGHWSGDTAVAIGSVLSGMLFVGWSLYWFSARVGDPLAMAAAVAALLTQGFMAIFFGHVENYSYLAVALLLFFTKGVDFLEGRSGLFAPLAAGIVAYAFHILGGLTIVPAGVLVAHGLTLRGRRAHTIATVLAVVALLVVTAIAASALYGPRSPLAGVWVGAMRVLTNAKDMSAQAILSDRHWANVWSELTLLGPLSLPWLGITAVLLVSAGSARSAQAAFLLLGALVLLGPCLVTGEGNLGAARNWDLFAAPALAAPFAGLWLLHRSLGPEQARRLMLALLAASIFHTAPWIVLNTDLDRTMARVARLPLTAGRGETMIGTYYLNRDDLPQAEEWFRRAIARDSLNCNSQSGLGLVLARSNRLEEAVRPMVAAVRLRPGVTGYQDDLIALFLALDRRDAAAAVLRHRLGIEPTHVASWLMLAQCVALQGDDAGAIAVLEEGYRATGRDGALLAPLGDAYEHAVVEHARRHEYAAARAMLVRFARTCPGDPRLAPLQARLP